VWRSVGRWKWMDRITMTASLMMNGTSSFMQRNPCCTTLVSHGAKSQTSLTCQWSATMVLKHASLLAPFSCTTSRRNYFGNNFGLYRHDGLGISNASPRQVELIKKDLCRIFNKYSVLPLRSHLKPTRKS